MTTQAYHIPGFSDPSAPKLLSFQRFVLLQSSDRTCSSLQASPQSPESHQTPVDSPSQNSKGNALNSPSKRSMSSLRSKGNKKSGTILRAVPETTACPTALLSDQRDTTTHACQHVSTKAQPGDQPSSSPTCYEASRSRAHSRNTSLTSSVKLSSVGELKSAISNTSLKGAIGVYKHGKIQWRQKDQHHTDKATRNKQSTDRNSRPKIQVVIPRPPHERPLPAIPFIGNPSKNHIVTACSHSNNTHDVSPPSASMKAIMRNSVVSPLNQTQPISFGQFQRSMSRVMRKTSGQTPKKHNHVSKPSGSSVDSQGSDSGSTYSTGSSKTSFETESPAQDMKHTRHYSVQNPVAAGVFDSSPETYAKPPPSFPPRRYAHQPSAELDGAFQPTCSLQRPCQASSALSRKPTLVRKSSKRPTQQRSLATSDGVIDSAISRSTSRQLSNPLRGPSPTLSEAENDLEEHLTTLAEEIKAPFSSGGEEQETSAWTEASPFDWGEGLAQEKLNAFVGRLRKDSETIDVTITSPPAVPRKSSKRQSSAHTEAPQFSRTSGKHIVSQMERGRSRGRSPRLTITIPDYKQATTRFEHSAMPSEPNEAKRCITPSSAERVILTIFQSLDHFDDLFATAVVNRGFYRVFKRHELDLVKSTLRKMSPPAWEFREIAFPGHDMLHDEDLEMTRPQEEYTTSSYIMLQKRDVGVIRMIKSLIKERCQSFVRPEIAIALISDDLNETARIDDALWRIWTFCKIFGSGKGREEDIVAQQDWLKGGLMVHQQACSFSIMSTDYMNDTLISAPECFAKGNEGGLTAEQLFDMMELWNCLGVLLQGFDGEGRTAQARECGIYENTEVRGGDIDGEEAMLDEWCYYLLTFGLSTVLELNGPSRQMNSTPFKVAAQHGWTNWTPPVFGGTRRSFLKEAASRVYEDKIAHTYATTSTRDIQRQLSKQRIQKHITELRERKTNGTRMPVIRMSQERPMSEWSTVIGNLTRPRPPPSTENNIVSYIPSLRSSALAQELTASIAELPVSRTPEPNTRSSSPPRRTVAQPLLPTPPPSTVPSTRDRSSIATMSMPSISEHPAYRNEKSSIPDVPSLAEHPAFRHSPPPSAPLPLQQRDLHTLNYSHRRSQSDHSARSQSSTPSQPAFQQHPTQHTIFSSQAHENTAEKAIYRVVEMGFTPEQAREALRMTDLGDGLRVNHAVEMLLCGQRGPERRGRISYV